MAQLFNCTIASNVYTTKNSTTNRKMPSNKALNTAKPTKMTTSSTDSIFQIRIAQCEDRERLLNFIREHYYREEPLTIGCEPKTQEVADEEFTMSNIQYGTCVMAVKEQNNEELIVGAVLAGPKDRHEVEHMLEEAALYGSQSKWGRILGILACIERDANVFERFHVERAVHAHALGVHKNFRGHALGFRIMEKLIEVGRKLNYELLTTDCTSIYSARLCERLGMECVNKLRYEDYRDEQGKQVFKPPPPHDVIETYALRL